MAYCRLHEVTHHAAPMCSMARIGMDTMADASTPTRGITRAAAAGLTPPFLIVNPKAYLWGAELLRLARLTDELAGQFGIATIFTAQHVDLRAVVEGTDHLLVSAQHLDGIEPGRGMGHILPEGLAAAGARAVVLNHAEHQLSLAQLDAAMRRAHEVGLLSIVCADTDAQCRAVATLGPDVMICEPTANIGTGVMDAGDYVERTTRIVKAVDPSILIIQAAGVSRGSDVARVIRQGADGSGGTSGIIKAPDWREILTEMYQALRDAKNETAR